MYVLITHSCGVIDDVRAFSESDKAYAATFEAIKNLLPAEKAGWIHLTRAEDLKVTRYIREFESSSVQYCVEHWDDMAELVSDGMGDEIHLVKAELE